MEHLAGSLGTGCWSCSGPFGAGSVSSGAGPFGAGSLGTGCWSCSGLFGSLLGSALDGVLSLGLKPVGTGSPFGDGPLRGMTL